MSLEPVPVRIEPDVVPAHVLAFIADAEERIDSWMTDQARRTPLGFVPSDFPRVYATLHELGERRLVPGQQLLEWGSGFGVVASMATWLDYETFGIEIHRELAEQAELLAADYELPAQFHVGSFVPPDGEPLTDSVPDSHWLESGRPAYEDMGLQVDDFDLIFAYPWPGEEEVTFALFEHFAEPGALLVTYHGYEGIKVVRRA